MPFSFSMLSNLLSQAPTTITFLRRTFMPSLRRDHIVISYQSFLWKEPTCNYHATILSRLTSQTLITTSRLGLLIRIVLFELILLVRGGRCYESLLWAFKSGFSFSKFQGHHKKRRNDCIRRDAIALCFRFRSPSASYPCCISHFCSSPSVDPIYFLMSRGATRAHR